MDPKQDVPTGRLQRFMKLSGLSSQVTASTLGQKVKGLFQKEEDRVRSTLENQIRNAERMVETMGYLKGAVMKVGQMISLHDGEGMPKEIADVLSRLQAQAPPLKYERIEEQFRAAFDASPQELFLEFDRQPMASASLGQVHRGVTHDGQEVAIKIQYPGIADTISSDLQNLRTLFDAMGVVSRRFETEGIFGEIRARLLEEVDYVQEAINLETFRALYKDDPRVVIPRYLPRYSSERILTMELIHGLSTQQMLEAGLSQEAKNQLGVNLLDIFLKQLLHFDMIHGDPHHGNYLFLPDGRFALLDFGCVKRLPPGFMKTYRALTLATLNDDRAGMVTHLITLGFLADDKNVRANELLVDVCRIFLTPFLEDKTYHFGSSQLHELGQDIPKRFLALGAMKFPADALYLNRVFIGLYFLLRKLDATANWHRLLKSHLTTLG